jgi:hypothetical protein
MASLTERSKPHKLPLAHPQVVQRLAAYYDTSGDYAGRTFTDAGPIDANSFNAADLFAVALLQVTIAPRAARVFLDDGTEHSLLLEALTALPSDDDLALAGDETLTAMARLYTTVKATLGKDPWVTASKICARKRPRLFPVRDKRVRMLLGLYARRDYTIDWQVFAHIMSQVEVVTTLHEVAAEAGKSAPDWGVSLDPFPLRHLDVLLWMDARAKGVGGAPR